MANKFSSKLLSEIKRATKARGAFFVLGELEGRDKFLETFTEALKSRGWPFAPTDRHKSEMQQFVDEALTNTLGYFRGQQVYHVNFWFERLSASEQAFVQSPKTIEIISQATDAAIAATAPEYGNPDAVRKNLRSVWSAFGNSIKSWAGIGQDNPAGNMRKTFKDVVAVMSAYRDKGVPSYEFQGRLVERLEDMKWPINDPKDIHKPLQGELWTLMGDTESKTAVDYYYDLQDDTYPARKPYRAAKDFLLSHFNDVTAAAKEIAKELDAELATADGLITRHITIVGREDKTNFKKK